MFLYYCYCCETKNYKFKNNNGKHEKNVEEIKALMHFIGFEDEFILRSSKKNNVGKIQFHILQKMVLNSQN